MRDFAGHDTDLTVFSIRPLVACLFEVAGISVRLTHLGSAKSPAMELAGDSATAADQWEQRHDETSGQIYYVNLVTGESSWEAPAGLRNHGPISSRHQWTEATDESGRVYYMNVATIETTWDPPPGFIGTAHESSAFRPSTAEQMEQLNALLSGGDGDVDDGEGEELQEHETQAAASIPTGISPVVIDDLAPGAETTTLAVEDGSEWMMFINEADGLPYYYNYITGECVWEPPAAFLEHHAQLADAEGTGAVDEAAIAQGGDDEFHPRILTPQTLAPSTPIQITPEFEDKVRRAIESVSKTPVGSSRLLFVRTPTVKSLDSSRPASRPASSSGASARQRVFTARVQHGEDETSTGVGVDEILDRNHSEEVQDRSAHDALEQPTASSLEALDLPPRDEEIELLRHDVMMVDLIRDEMALTIQCLVRCFLARARVARKRAEKRLVTEPQSSTSRIIDSFNDMNVLENQVESPSDEQSIVSLPVAANEFRVTESHTNQGHDVGSARAEPLYSPDPSSDDSIEVAVVSERREAQKQDDDPHIHPIEAIDGESVEAALNLKCNDVQKQEDDHPCVDIIDNPDGEAAATLNVSACPDDELSQLTEKETMSSICNQQTEELKNLLHVTEPNLVHDLNQHSSERTTPRLVSDIVDLNDNPEDNAETEEAALANTLEYDASQTDGDIPVADTHDHGATPPAEAITGHHILEPAMPTQRSEEAAHLHLDREDKLSGNVREPFNESEASIVTVQSDVDKHDMSQLGAPQIISSEDALLDDIAPLKQSSRETRIESSNLSARSTERQAESSERGKSNLTSRTPWTQILNPATIDSTSGMLAILDVANFFPPIRHSDRRNKVIPTPVGVVSTALAGGITRKVVPADNRNEVRSVARLKTSQQSDQAKGVRVETMNSSRELARTKWCDEVEHCRQVFAASALQFSRRAQEVAATEVARQNLTKEAQSNWLAEQRSRHRLDSTSEETSLSLWEYTRGDGTFEGARARILASMDPQTFVRSMMRERLAVIHRVIERHKCTEDLTDSSKESCAYWQKLASCFPSSLEKGTSIDHPYWAKLHAKLEAMTRNGSVDIVNQFSHHRTDEFDSLLHAAAWRGHLDFVVFLVLDLHVDVNAIDNTLARTTPLHEACRGGHIAVVDFLLSRGAYLDAVDYHGETPLHVACRLGWTQVVSNLIEAGEAQDDTGSDPSCPHVLQKLSWVEYFHLRNGKHRRAMDLATLPSLVDYLTHYSSGLPSHHAGTSTVSTDAIDRHRRPVLKKKKVKPLRPKSAAKSNPITAR